MIEFSATFGNIDLRVKALPYQGPTDTLPLGADDRMDLEDETAAIFEIHILGQHSEHPGLTIEFIEPFVVVGLHNDDDELASAEELMDEINMLIEEAFLAKVEHHFELVGREAATPPWADKD